MQEPFSWASSLIFLLRETSERAPEEFDQHSALGDKYSCREAAALQCFCNVCNLLENHRRWECRNRAPKVRLLEINSPPNDTRINVIGSTLWSSTKLGPLIGLEPIIQIFMTGEKCWNDQLLRSTSNIASSRTHGSRHLFQGCRSSSSVNRTLVHAVKNHKAASTGPLTPASNTAPDVVPKSPRYRRWTETLTVRFC